MVGGISRKGKVVLSGSKSLPKLQLSNDETDQNHHFSRSRPVKVMVADHMYTCGPASNWIFSLTSMYNSLFLARLLQVPVGKTLFLLTKSDRTNLPAIKYIHACLNIEKVASYHRSLLGAKSLYFLLQK